MEPASPEPERVELKEEGSRGNLGHEEAREEGREEGRASDLSRSLVPPRPVYVVPWLRACRGAWADVDMFDTDRKPTWLGGLCTLSFFLIFFIVLVVALLQSSTYHEVDGVESTSGNVYPITIQCLSDAVPGDIGLVYCLVDITYNYTYTVLENGENVLVQHPCNIYNQRLQIYRGNMEVVNLCQSPGIDDGIVITTVPTVNKAVIYEVSTNSIFAIPQQPQGRFELSVTRVEYRDENADGKIKVKSYGWDLSPLTINRDTNNAIGWNYTHDNTTTEVYNSTSILRTSSTFMTVTNQEEIQTPSIGAVGGSAFLLYLAMKLIADVHIRCVGPYRGQLEPGPLVAMKKRRRTRSM